MITSRRSFLRFAAGAATVAATPWPLSGASGTGRFDSSRFSQDDGFIRLNSNENAYGPSARGSRGHKIFHWERKPLSLDAI